MSLDYEYPYTAHFYEEGELKSVQIRLDPSSKRYLDSDESVIHIDEHGLIHREDGPAVYAKEQKYWFDKPSWFIKGVELTEEEFNDYLDKKNLKNSLESDLEEKEAKGQRKL